MKPKALVVEDDERVIESIEDLLFSIGHEYDWVTNQQDAQERLTDGEYAYVLLDLQIPAKPNRGGADKEYGANLLDDIQRIKGRRHLPVIIMTAFSADCLDLTTLLFARGASEFIAKPFTNKGRTLASVVRKVLDEHRQTMADGVSTKGANGNGAPRRFQDGELVFFPDRVELCGVRIVSDRGAGQCLLVLRELRRQDSAGRYVRRSAEELAVAIKAPGGAGTVTGCIKRIRDNIVQRLRKELGADCGRDDVIQNNEQGYSLRDWIVAREGEYAAPLVTLHHRLVRSVDLARPYRVDRLHNTLYGVLPIPSSHPRELQIRYARLVGNVIEQSNHFRPRAIQPVG